MSPCSTNFRIDKILVWFSFYTILNQMQMMTSLIAKKLLPFMDDLTIYIEDFLFHISLYILDRQIAFSRHFQWMNKLLSDDFITILQRVSPKSIHIVLHSSVP